MFISIVSMLIIYLNGKPLLLKIPEWMSSNSPILNLGIYSAFPCLIEIIPSDSERGCSVVLQFE